MADFSRRGPGCDNDCDGESGERGERGERGKRGHRGETGATGPTGPSGNDEPWPPFPNPVTLTKIFANVNGSDATGDGSQGNPYRTFQEAIRHVPRQVTPGHRVMVDITNLGPELLPPNYALPVLETPFGIEATWSSPFAPDYYPFTTMLGVDIIAKPRPATLAQGSNTLGPADMVVGFDGDTNLVLIQTNQDYGAADTLKGYLVQDGVGLRGVIWHNTAGPNSIIFLTIPQTQDQFILPVFSSMGFPPPPGFPVPFPPGGSLQIVERTAEFITQKDPTNIIQGGFLIAGSGAISIRGVDIHLAAPFFNPAGYDLEIFRSATICLEGCKLDGLLAVHSPGQICVINTHIHSAVVATEAPIGMFSVFCENIPSFGTTWITPTAFNALGFVLDGCAALGPRYHPLQPIGRGPMIDLALRSGVIRRSKIDTLSGAIAGPENFPAPFSPVPPLAFPIPGYGILLRGGHGMIDHVKIFDCASDAIHFEGNGLLELKSVTGGQGGIVFGDLLDTPNGGYGLFLDDGGHVRVSDQDPVPNAVLTNVRGAITDIHVGTLPDLPLWTNLYALVPQNYLDIQLAGGAGVTAQGTASRLFVKPPNP